jgi:Calcineurin-like phosphoesterase
MTRLLNCFGMRHSIHLLIAAIVVAVLTEGTHASRALADASCVIDGVERIVAIGDVHGAYDRFVEILKASGLIDGQLKWSGGAAHFVQLGDVVDRGPDSRRALDLLQQLQREAKRAGGAVHPLLGNHEVARMLGDMRFATPGEYRAFVTDRSADVRESYLRTQPAALREQLLRDTPLGFVELRMAFGRNGEYGKWLRTLDTVVRINGVVFLHGGLSRTTAALTCDEVNSTVRRDLGADLDKTRAAPLTTLTAREDGPLWYRGLTEMAEADVDAVLEKQGARAMVVGHTIARTGRITLHSGAKVIAIDTGMQSEYAQGGRASALELRGDTITAIYTDSREVLRSQ